MMVGEADSALTQAMEIRGHVGRHEIGAQTVHDDQEVRALQAVRRVVGVLTRGGEDGDREQRP